MTTLVRFETAAPDGEESSILVEVDEYDLGMERVSIDEDSVAEAGRRLEDILAGIRPALGAVMTALRDLGPTEHEIEFGIKLNVQAGVIIAKTTTEGHFTVRLKWSREQHDR